MAAHVCGCPGAHLPSCLQGAPRGRIRQSRGLTLPIDRESRPLVITAKSALAVPTGTATRCHRTATRSEPVNIDYCHEVPTCCHYCRQYGRYRAGSFGSNKPEYRFKAVYLRVLRLVANLRSPRATEWI